jgi:hypothetical protein
LSFHGKHCLHRPSAPGCLIGRNIRIVAAFGLEPKRLDFGRLSVRRILPVTLLLAVSSCAIIAPPATRQPGYVVFFDAHSAVLDSAGNGVVASAAAAAKAAPHAAVTVYGYADSKGNVSADMALSVLRAKAVADTLVADGVPIERIVRQGRGQTHEDPGIASRRVEIDVGG